MKLIIIDSEYNQTVYEKSLSEIKDLIKEETGRGLEIYQNERLDLLSLIKFPQPIGFAIVANELIPANTYICEYGGRRLTDDEANTANIEYLMRAVVPNNEVIYQAKESGGFGSLFSCLPGAGTLIALAIKKPYEFQTANVIDFIENDRICFKSTKEIPKGAIIGFDYGLQYWASKFCEAPCLFKEGGSGEIYGWDKVNYDPLIFAIDRACGNFPKNKFIPEQHILLGASSRQINCEFTKKSELHIESYGKESKVTMLKSEWEEFNRITQRNPLMFFTTSTNYSGCMPPPGYTIDDLNNTHVPQI